MARKDTMEYWMRRIRQVYNQRSGLCLTGNMLSDRLMVNRHSRPSFLMALRQLERSGELKRDACGRIWMDEGGTATARDHRRTTRGLLRSLHPHFGFVTLDGEGEDCFIPGEHLGGALPGDGVEVVSIFRSEKGLQGRINKVFPGRRVFAGQLYNENRLWYVRPTHGFHYDLPVRGTDGCQVGDIVRITISNGRFRAVYAYVEERYGSGDRAKVCADAIITQHGLPVDFDDDVLVEAQRRASQPIEDKELAWRNDLREQLVFTIDGADAKDLDDAVSLTVLEDGWELGVHIADVSYYVTPNSAIDREALERTTSVYFADRVIPMLPPALSNDACSLQAGEDKRTLSALIRLNSRGDIVDCHLCKSIICSRVRGVYSEVNAVLDGTATPNMQEKYQPVLSTLEAMVELYNLLYKNAHTRGVFQLGGVESRVVLDDQGVAVDVQPRCVGRAEGMIEQFMITANIAVAALARKHTLPFVYRVHESPNEERLSRLFDLTRSKDLPTPLSATGVIPKALQALTEAASKTPYGRLVGDQLLRCMAKARYDTQALGHYGLVLGDYCHFTSPIRRYPDLMIHRVLSRWLAGEKAGRLHAKVDGVVQQTAKSASLGELRGLAVERACEACYKAEYMRAHLGECIDGLVVSVTENGLYVELPNTVSGLLPVENLPEDGLYFDDFLSLTDRTGRPVYTVGQYLQVRVAACYVPEGRILFDLEKKLD